MSTSSGVVVADVDEGGPAAHAGLRVGDVRVEGISLAHAKFTDAGVLTESHVQANSAEHLQTLLSVPAREGRDGDVVAPGTILVAPGGGRPPATDPSACAIRERR